jgi:hypothetical protein
MGSINMEEANEEENNSQNNIQTGQLHEIGENMNRNNEVPKEKENNLSPANENQLAHNTQGNNSNNGANSSEGWVITENIHLGIVRTFSLFPPPPLAPSFSNPTQPLAQTDKELISVPKEWASFFKGLLDSPAQQPWAKKLMESGFLSMLQHSTSTSTSLISLKNQPSSNPCKLLSKAPILVTEIEVPP